METVSWFSMIVVYFKNSLSVSGYVCRGFLVLDWLWKCRNSTGRNTLRNADILQLH